MTTKNKPVYICIDSDGFSGVGNTPQQAYCDLQNNSEAEPLATCVFYKGCKTHVVVTVVEKP